jgi:hypothetical protein
MEINKYHNSKIYKIVSNHTDKIYIGSTIQLLCKRIYKHKKDYEYFKNNIGRHIRSFDLLELGDVDIILLENVKCESKEELHAKERYYIELNKEICVNKNIPTRTDKEYKKDNIEKIKQYANDNKETRKEYKKEYYQKNSEKLKEKFNCECGGKYTSISKQRHLKLKIHTNYINGD